ncbi:MAG: DUF4368 domain-containing protein [Oscillospiraceae bacterium]|nr:DUF4368 domain-containing protein [Oscillospiraceae bacterium]
MLNALIEKIEIHHAERIDGVNMQSLIIHYNCMGYVDIPNKKELPEVDVTVGTRQGVVTNYLPAKLTGNYKNKRSVFTAFVRRLCRWKFNYNFAKISKIVVEFISNAVKTPLLVGATGFEPAAT